MTSNNAGARWIGHPLLGAFAATGQLIVFVKFTLWNSQSQTYDPLPAGIDVTLRDNSPLIGSQPIATVQTVAGGIANFNIFNLTPQFPDLFFVVDTSALPAGFANHPAFATEWSTKGWRSSDGNEYGYKEHFAGTIFGTAANPIEFEIGVTLFLDIEVESTSEPGTYLSLLRNTPVNVFAQQLLTSALQIDVWVNERGIAECFSFDIGANADIAVKVSSSNYSAGIVFPCLQNVIVGDWTGTSNAVWSYFLNKTLTNIAGIDRTTIGAPAAGWPVKLSAQDSSETCAAFTALRSLTEVNSLINYTATPGDWANYQGVHVNVRALLPGGLSIPNGSSPPGFGSINLPAFMDTWRAGTIHECAHQILWVLGKFDLNSIASTYFFGNGVMSHNWRSFYNPTHALLEGWADGISFFFGLESFDVQKISGQFKISYIGPSVINGVLTSGISQGVIQDANEVDLPAGKLDDEPNWGENVESVFGAGLYYVFREHVMGMFLTAVPIPATTAGNIAANPSLAWLTSTAPADVSTRERFRKTFLEPAKAMAAPGADRTTTGFIEAMRAANTAADWAIICPILQRYYLAHPEIRTVAPANLAAAGGAQVVIQGRHIFAGAGTEVYFGANLATITSLSTSQIKCTAPPGTAGTTVALKLITPDGVDIKNNAITYA